MSGLDRCPSMLYAECNQRTCTPVMRHMYDDQLRLASEQGFNIDPGYGDPCLRLCTAILRQEHADRLAAITTINPEIDAADIRLSENTTGVIIALDEDRYRTRVKVEEANGLI